jgi:hypothetical protein
MKIHVMRKHPGKTISVGNTEGTIYPAQQSFNSMRQTSYVTFNNNANEWDNIPESDRVLDFLDRQINIQERLVKFQNLNYQANSPYPSQPYVYNPNYYVPFSSYQYFPGLPNISNIATARSDATFLRNSTMPFDHSSVASITQAVENKVNNQIEPSDPIALTALICEKCVVVDFIPKCENKDKTLTEIRTHSCIHERVVEIDRIGNLKLKNFADLLHKLLPTLFGALILKCKTSKNIHLCFVKLGSISSPPGEHFANRSLMCPIRVLDTTKEVEYRWFSGIQDSQSQEGYIRLESTDELLSFLKVSIDSTFIMLAVRHEISLSGSASIYDLFFVGLDLSGFRLGQVKPFIPKLKLLGDSEVIPFSF